MSLGEILTNQLVVYVVGSLSNLFIYAMSGSEVDCGKDHHLGGSHASKLHITEWTFISLHAGKGHERESSITYILDSREMRGLRGTSGRWQYSRTVPLTESGSPLQTAFCLALLGIGGHRGRAIASNELPLRCLGLENDRRYG